ncbi:MAG: hypothetical protein Q9227_008783 [Pyrenula ochraceoflavens]
MKGGDLKVVRDLTRILDQAKKTATLETLNSRDFISLFEPLFQLIKREKASYARTSHGNPRNISAGRLSAAANAISLAVEIGLGIIKFKTAHAIIDHLLDCLPDTGDGIYCQPLSSDYLKTLKRILQHAPHREHLRSKTWEELVDFICSGIGEILAEQPSFSAGKTQAASRTPLTSFSESSHNARSTPLRVSQKPDPQRMPQEPASALDTLVFCLDSITSCSNNSLPSKAEKVFYTLSSFISLSSTSTTTSQVPAFHAINCVLEQVITQKTDLARQIIISLIPSLGRFWLIKSNSLRDEILVTLTLGLRLLTRSAVEATSNGTIASMENLLESFRNEYFRRKERDLLLIDDINFFADDSFGPTSLDFIGPRFQSTRSVSNLSMMATIASLISCLDACQPLAAEDDESPTNPEKRQRLMRPSEDIVRQAWSSQGLDRLFCLQTLPWLLSSSAKAREDFADHIDHFEGGLVDDDASIASWSAVTLACISIPGCSRSACLLIGRTFQLRLLDSTEALRIAHTVVGSDSLSHAPALSDSSLILHEAFIDLKLQVNPFLAKEAFVNLMKWLDSAWDLRTILDRAHTRQLAEHAVPWRLLNLLCTCSGRKKKFTNHKLATLSSSIIRSWLSQQQNQDLQNYLLLCDSSEPPKHNVSEKKEFGPNEGRDGRIDRLVLDALSAKLKQFRDAWHSIQSDRVSNINPDLVQLLAAACIIGDCFATICGPFFGSLCAAIQKESAMLWGEIRSFLSLKTYESVQPYLQAMIIPMSLQSQDENDRTIFRGLISSMVAFTHEKLNDERSFDPSTGSLEDSSQTDLLDLDESKASQSSQKIKHSVAVSFYREYFPNPDRIFFSPREVSRYLYLTNFSSISHHEENLNEITRFQEIIMLLEGAELLQTRAALLEVFLDSSLSRSVACTLLRHLAEQCLEPYAFNRCEASLCLCVECLTASAPLWLAEVDDQLRDVVLQLYQWLTEDALDQGHASPRLLRCITALIAEVLRINSSFQSSPAGPSPRTILFRLMDHHDKTVQYEAGKIVPSLFGHFVLTEHEAMFADVLGALPANPSDTEGLAIRLHVLASLASRWHSIARSAVYRIFETAASICAVVPYAKVCLQSVSLARGNTSLNSFFRQLAPHIMYSWLGENSLERLPYAAFDYSSLKEMLSDIEPEIVAQIAMRCDDVAAENLSNILQSSYRELLVRSFPSAEACCLARDICLPPSDDPAKGSTEAAMRKHIGSETTTSLMKKNFPIIFSEIFQRMDQEATAEKAFSKRPEFSKSLNILRRLNQAGSGSYYLPLTQQPSFRARCIIEEIEYLCRRSGIDLASIWHPSLLIYVARDLFSATSPALGPFFSCAILRKIKVLIALFGPCAYSEYALQMLLHNLKPFLNNFYCSEAAIGLFRFLLTEGKPYIEKDLPFLSGLALSTFLTMKDFLVSPQDSTTQQSHHDRTISNAHEFLQWFAAYVEQMRPGGYEYTTFAHVVDAVKSMSNGGNAIQVLTEGDLLRALLQDQSGPNPLLPQTTFDLTMQSLCKNSGGSDSISRFVAIDDDLAIQIATVLWDLIKRIDVGHDFRIWIAQIMGQAYASTGQMGNFLIKEHDHTVTSPFNEGANSIASGISIIRNLNKFLWSDIPGAASLAERTLQIIVEYLNQTGLTEPLDEGLEPNVLIALSWTGIPCPPLWKNRPRSFVVEDLLDSKVETRVEEWSAQLALKICSKAQNDPILGALGSFLGDFTSIAPNILPYIAHRSLVATQDSAEAVDDLLSRNFRAVIKQKADELQSHLAIILHTAVYLRQQPFSHEFTILDREKWLGMTNSELATAAVQCRMFRTALLFVELSESGTSRSSRRSVYIKDPLPQDLLQEIFENLEDPDYFYGLSQDASISSIIKKLQHEGSDLRALSFQSAQHDSILKLGLDDDGLKNSSDIVRALSSANLDGIAYNMFQSSQSITEPNTAGGDVARTSLNLQEWALPVAHAHSISGGVIEALRCMSQSSNLAQVPSILEQALQGALTQLTKGRIVGDPLHDAMSSIAAIAGLQELWKCTSLEELHELMAKIEQRNRHAEFNSIRKQSRLRDRLHVTLRDAYLLETHCTRESLQMSIKVEAPQPALNIAVHLSNLARNAATIGLDIQTTAASDLAKVLWDQGEQLVAIRTLADLREIKEMHKEAIPISRARLLADLGQYSAEARVENPEKVIDHYLLPAIRELKGSTSGAVQGRVFHEFASFCDLRLQSPDDLDDFARIEKLRHRKEQELSDLERMINATENKQRRDTLRHHYNRALPWFKLDDQEYQRLRKTRERLVYQSLENYLRALKACDDYENDVLRFCAIWMSHSDSENANSAVENEIADVPSYKFAPLMNQLSSRLLNVKDKFQPLLFDLIMRICRDHPFHGMYQIFATSKSRHGGEDTAVSRHSAAQKMAEKFQRNHLTGPTWVFIHNSSIAYIKFANEKIEDKRQGKMPIRSISSGAKMENEALKSTTRLPPPAIKMPLRADCDYSNVSRIAKFEPNFSIASGVSAPKIVTIVGSDGKRYKQLFKGGNDDLRQDAIMEQVFEQVSNLLKDHRATRQRKLGIRTYKVLPLHTNAGIIEFVQNTTPLHDYLLPAHAKYHPKDMKASQCRKVIQDAQNRSIEHRIQSYRKVKEKFNPVMRYFFFERFPNPDDWFVRRLAYSRSTAAISILGHVLGLGDRHGHNILLDEHTGEVVHIDLGVAFETGRVLPVPEVVPFRLTRDLVDGMGITKTEGVFRRCCNFTLEALRRESYSIMTILDVLRYDPLYSWSISPLRIKRMQEESQNEGNAETAPGGGGGGGGGGNKATTTTTAAGGKRKEMMDETSEADRALTVVEKKLGKSLSVEATVNELIRQATDERNLAVLYCGWAAYA